MEKNQPMNACIYLAYVWENLHSTGLSTSQPKLTDVENNDGAKERALENVAIQLPDVYGKNQSKANYAARQWCVLWPMMIEMRLSTVNCSTFIASRGQRGREK